MNYKQFWQTLAPTYGEGEAKAMARIVFEDVFGMTLSDIVCGKDQQMNQSEKAKASDMLDRLMQNEPLQYVVGTTVFCNHKIGVAPGVLIPRPETEQLCQIAIEEVQRITSRPCILDIGTGSGCIAITLKKAQSESYVEAWDISQQALSIAQDNAKKLDAEIVFRQQDILKLANSSINSPSAFRDGVAKRLRSSLYCAAHQRKWDIVVSNPPYICMDEKAEIELNVLDNEPHEALFVPNDTPLLFYEAIARYAQTALKEGGSLMFEINPRFANDMADMLNSYGYCNIVLHNDIFNRQRFVTANKRNFE